jgi:Uncharacterized NAD(FAD)-dependent dehydrogenases
MRYIIVGGVAGGATAAARIRRIDETCEIIILEKGEHISYANCGLPYYIGNVIKHRENLLLQTPQSFFNRFNIDVRVLSEAVKINIQEKKIFVVKRDVEGNILQEYSLEYDKLLLSPGANPVKPPFPGLDSPGIFTLRNVEDTDNIANYISENKVKSAVIVGAGFIGLEMAENLHNRGVKVSIVEMANQVMAPIDFSMAQIVHQELQQKGVELFLGEAVEAFSKNNEGELEVNLKSGRKIKTNMVLLSIGVRPNVKLAQDAGIELGAMGGIKVDEFLQTSDKNVYAVGDAVEFPHPITKKPWLNYLACPANRQARIVADNIVKGNVIKYTGSIGTAIAKVFDLDVAATGLPAKRLKQEGIEYLSATIHPLSNAGYYPGAKSLTIKITFEKGSGKLLGGQIVGYAGVDKRIDEIALVIKNGGTIYDLINIEHAYAPPFSSAKDPVAMAGYVASNILNGSMKPIYWRELEQIVSNNEKNTILLDVRTKEEFQMGSIEGSVNIPLDDLRQILDDLDCNGGCDLPDKYSKILKPDNEIVTICAVGLRGYLALRLLDQNGFKNVRNLVGGYKTYKISTCDITLNKGNFCEVASNNDESINNIKASVEPIVVDACGLQCPGPILKLKKSIDELEVSQRVKIISTDAGFVRDVQAWCNTTGNILIDKKQENGEFIAVIEKGRGVNNGVRVNNGGDGKTFIMFSDSLDKVLATFVMANGAAATGKKVTIFFTFWGLNAIKKENKPKVKKDIWGKMFGFMLPSSSKGLKLSQMSMMGIGGKMMRHIMREKGVDSLESLRQQAIDNGVEFIACQMSMDVMGVKKEELLDNVTIGGVATYMDRANQANFNLFI